MTVSYDRETETLSVNFRHAQIAESDEEHPGIILDYDESGHLVSMELLDASRSVENPDVVNLVVVGQP